MNGGTSARNLKFVAAGKDPAARLRLFCFPPAGGGAAIFHNWATGLPPGVQVCPVQLPGRAERWREKPFTDLPALLEELIPVLVPLAEIPFAVFGHSMGALIGFELAREFRRLGLNPVCLFVSALRAPHLPNPLPAVHQLPEAAFIHEIQTRYDAIAPAILSDAEARRLFLPVLRADMKMLESYVYRSSEPLALPISAFAGADDRLLSNADVAGWQEQTRGSFRFRVVPGGHFFLRDSRSELLSVLANDLRETGACHARAPTLK